MKMHIKLFFSLALFLFLLPAVFALTEVYHFSDTKKAILYDDLIKNLRCLVCQNENLADSNADLAIDLKNQIYQKVQAGQSKEAIEAELVAHFGEFILYDPPVDKKTVFIWVAPFLALLLGFFVLFYRIIRYRG